MCVQAVSDRRVGDRVDRRARRDARRRAAQDVLGEVRGAVAEDRHDVGLIPHLDAGLAAVGGAVVGQVEIGRVPLDRDVAPEVVDPVVRPRSWNAVLCW